MKRFATRRSLTTRITLMAVILVVALTAPYGSARAAITMYQAENATLTNAVVESNHTGFTGTGFVNYNNVAGSAVQWVINVPQSTTAKLTFRFSNGTTTNRPMSISVNGVVVNGNLAFNGTGTWDTWATLSLNAALNAGNNTIRAAATTANGGPNVDRLDVDDMVSGNNGTPHGGTAWAVPGTIQVEDYNDGGQGVAFNDTDTTNNGGAYRPSEAVDIQATTDTGGGFNVGWTRVGEWLKYTVNVGTAGSYTFNARVAAAAAGAKFHAEIDGANVTGALSVPNTGGNQTWTTISKSGISLTAGQHVLRVVFDTAVTGGTAAGNFNFFSFSNGGSVTPTPITPTPITPTPITPTPITPTPNQPPTAAEILAKLNGCTQISNGLYKTDSEKSRTIPVCKKTGAVFWKADMDIDCDGVRTAQCNENTDCCFLPDTFCHSSSGPLNAAQLPYMVVPSPSGTWDYRNFNIGCGAVVAIIFNGKVEYTVMGDTGPSDIIGEASYAAAKNLGINPDPSNGGTDEVVTYLIFQGSKSSPIDNHSNTVTLGQQLARQFINNN